MHKTCKHKRACKCDQSGRGLGDLAVKALSHLIPALLAKFGESAGSILSDQAVQFARRRGLLKASENQPETKQSGKGSRTTQKGGDLLVEQGQLGPSRIKKQQPLKPPAKGKSTLNHDVVQKGVRVSHVQQGLQNTDLQNKTPTTSYPADPTIIASVPKSTKRGSKKQTGGMSSVSHPHIGGSAELPGQTGNGNTLPGGSIFIPGDTSELPKKPRGRPKGSGKKKTQ